MLLAVIYIHKHYKDVYIGKAGSEFAHLLTLVFSFEAVVFLRFPFSCCMARKSFFFVNFVKGTFYPKLSM